MTEKILFVDSTHPSLPQRLSHAGCECIDGSAMSRREALAAIEDCTGIIIRSRMPVDREMLLRGKNLRFIARAGAGMENIDTGHAAQLGISCFNAPEGNRDAVAEHALGMLLCLMNNIASADREVRAGLRRREGR